MSSSGESYHLTISTPGGNVFSDEVTCLILRGLEGDLAVLKGHIPFATAVKPGPCTITTEDGGLIKSEIGGGLLSVGSDSVTLMTGSYKAV